jgi:ABC-type protease/lipase transport system fused ATPase/permease subunit
MRLVVTIGKYLAAVALFLGLAAAFVYFALWALIYMLVAWIFNPSLGWLYLAGACLIILTMLVRTIRGRRKRVYYHV